jgi:ketosteroid isomerase-like protein
MAKTIEERLQALEDREEILKLKARYVNYNDGGWNGPTHTNPQAVADMFTEDGIWDGAPDSGYAKGRQQIKELFESFGAVPFIVHYVTNPLIEIDGDTATGHWHALVTATMPGPQAIWILGIYKDDYVRRPEGWKFKSLRFDTIAATPYEKGWAKQRLAYAESPFKNVPVGDAQLPPPFAKAISDDP